MRMETCYFIVAKGEGNTFYWRAIQCGPECLAECLAARAGQSVPVRGLRQHSTLTKDSKLLLLGFAWEFVLKPIAAFIASDPKDRNTNYRVFQVSIAFAFFMAWNYAKVNNCLWTSKSWKSLFQKFKWPHRLLTDPNYLSRLLFFGTLR